MDLTARYAERFQKLDEEFLRYARSADLSDASGQGFDSVIAEAGSFAWKAAKEDLLGDVLRKRVDEAELCWHDIRAGKKPELEQFVYESRFEDPSEWPDLNTKKSKVTNVPGMHSFAIKNVSPAKLPRKQSKKKKILVHIQRIFFEDYMVMARKKALVGYCRAVPSNEAPRANYLIGRI